MADQNRYVAVFKGGPNHGLISYEDAEGYCLGRPEADGRIRRVEPVVGRAWKVGPRCVLSAWDAVGHERAAAIYHQAGMAQPDMAKYVVEQIVDDVIVLVYAPEDTPGEDAPGDGEPEDPTIRAGTLEGWNRRWGT